MVADSIRSKCSTELLPLQGMEVLSVLIAIYLDGTFRFASRACAVGHTKPGRSGSR